jgi:hypothetical protein
MKTIIATGIVADQPTSIGSIYTREALDSAVKKFNISAQNKPNLGSFADGLDPDKKEPVTHQTTSLFINDSGMLCATVHIIDKDLADRIANQKVNVIGRPIMTVLSSTVDTKPFTAASISRINRVQLECSDVEPERSQTEDQESRSG